MGQRRRSRGGKRRQQLAVTNYSFSGHSLPQSIGEDMETVPGFFFALHFIHQFCFLPC